MPCQSCVEDLWPLVNPNIDDFGEIKSKTVDFRRTKAEKEAEEQFRTELEKLKDSWLELREESYRLLFGD